MFGTNLTKNIVVHGAKPYSIVVLHGGPGAIGDVNDLAAEIAKRFKVGVLEPYLFELTVEEQLEGLAKRIKKYAQPPVILIGHSYGSKFASLFAAKYPQLVGKLILLGCCPYREQDAKGIGDRRLAKLSEAERKRFDKLTLDSKENFAKLGALLSKADTYAVKSSGHPKITDTRGYKIFTAVWPQISDLRKRGKLYQSLKKICCPVIAIQGDYDSHGVDVIKKAVEDNIKNLQFIVLKKCGHYPWREKYAHKEFFKCLNIE